MTIWGESAGAGSVIQHLVANGGKTNPPLLRAAMTSSTFLPSQYNFNDPIPEVRPRFYIVKQCSIGLRCLDTVHLQPSSYAGEVSEFRVIFMAKIKHVTSCTSEKDALECLRATDVNILQAANTEINSIGFYGTFVFVPVVDGTFIVERPTETTRKGILNAVRGLSVSSTVHIYLTEVAL